MRNYCDILLCVKSDFCESFYILTDVRYNLTNFKIIMSSNNAEFFYYGQNIFL